MNQTFQASLMKDNITPEQFKIYVQHVQSIYKKFYAFNPIERLAGINSYRTILEIIKDIVKYIPNLYEFEQANLTEEMLKGYPEATNLGGCPTQVYLYGVNRQSIWGNLPFYNADYQKLIQNVNTQYNLADGLKYGLPIQTEEYRCINFVLHKENKYNI